MREQLGIEPDAPIVLIMARLEPQKGHRVLLDAWRTVLDEFPRARLFCIGDGALREELTARASAPDLRASVTLVGYQSNVTDWLALATITVLPSFFEGLPLAAIESLAAGRPVVASAVDGTAEAVIHERTGLLVPPGVTEPLAAAITRLLRDPELRQTLGHQGRRLVESEFSAIRQVAETAAVYEGVLAASARAERVARCERRLTTRRSGLGENLN